MPKLDKATVLALLRTHRDYRGNMHKLAEATRIPYHSLRQAVGCGDSMRYERITYVADALGTDAEHLIQDGDEKPDQPKGPKGPPGGRKKKDDEKDSKGPKRPGAHLKAAS